MREVNFARDVIHGMAAILGIDAELDLMRDHARLWCASVNSKVRHGWGFWPWPEFQVTEERAFRQIWHTDVDYQAGQAENSEVYYIPTGLYYRAIGNPPVGNLPTNDSDPVYWEAIAAADLDRHLAYEQYGKQDIDRVISIDSETPRTASSGIRWNIAPSGYGIDLGTEAGPTFWVTYVPRAPEFTTSTYDSTRLYARGDLVLDLTTGDCYRALRPGSGHAIDQASYWLRQQFPYVLSEYVKYAASSEHAEDLQTRIALLDTGMNSLRDEVDKLIAQGQRSRYRLTVPLVRPFYPLGCSGLPV